MEVDRQLPDSTGEVPHDSPTEQSLRLYQQVVQRLPGAVYTCDADGRLKMFNDAAVELWGRTPIIGEDRWCGSWKIYHPDGTPMPLDDCPMAVTLRTGEAVRSKEIFIERPDGSRRLVLAHPEPILDADGGVVGAVNMLVDITDRQDARRSDLLLSAIVESSDDAIISMTLDGRISSWNSGARAMYGYESEEAIGRPVSMLIPEDRLAYDAELIQRIRQGERVDHFETVRLTRDGRRIEVSLSISPVRDSQGRIIGASKIARDITDRNKVRRALREMQDRFARFMQHLPGLAWIKDRDGRYVYANEAAERAFQVPRAKLYGRSDDEIFPRQTAAIFRANDQRVIDTGNEVESIETLTHGDGVHHSLVTKFPIPGPSDSPSLVGGVAIDVTDRLNAEQLLRDSELRFRTVAMNAPASIYIKDLQGRYLIANPLACQAMGRPSGIVGMTDRELLPAAQAEQLAQNDRRVIDLGVAMECEEVIGIKAPRNYLSVKCPMPDAAGRTIGVCGVAVDITDRKLAETALRESERRFRILADGAPVLIWVNGPHGCEFVNNAYLQFTGKSVHEVLGMKWSDGLHPDDSAGYLQRYTDAMAKQAPFEAQMRFRRHDGEYRWLLSTGLPRLNDDGAFLGYAGCSVDITDQMKAREALELQQSLLEDAVVSRTAQLEETNQRLRLAERMASLGTLSAGLGHDMGNLLVPLRVRLESLASSNLSQAQQEDVNAIGTAAEYLQRLSSGLRLLSVDPQRERSTDITELLSWWNDVSIVLKNAVPQGVRLISNMPAEPCGVGMPRAALTQVIFNLVQNAGDAIRRSDGGTVAVSVERHDDIVRIRVTDDGPGMSEEARQHCMEPFYTTKPRGMSTGLGLVLVYGLVRDSGGTVNIESTEGQGTTFTVDLPAREPATAPVDDDQRDLAFVQLDDARLRAFMAIELRYHKYDVTSDESQISKADLIVTDNPGSCARRRGDARLLVLGSGAGVANADSVTVLSGRPTPQLIREKLRALSKSNGVEQERG